MPYTNGITDQVVQYPNRFKIDGVSRTIEPDFGIVSDPGTSVNRDLITTILAGVGTTSGTAEALTLDQPGFVLQDGATVRIKLHTDMAAGATLNVNGTGAKAIKRTSGKVYPSTAAFTWITLTYSTQANAYFAVADTPAGSEIWQQLITHPYIKLVSGEVLSLDLSGIQTDRYRQFMLFAQGNAYISSGDERLRFRINNDASGSYAGTTLNNIHALDSSSTPYWTKAYNYNTVLMDFVPYSISATMPLSICAQFTPLGRHVQTQIQISNRRVTGLSFGSYWLAEGAEFSSIEMILHNFSGSRNVELNEIVLLGLEKGAM